MNEGRDGSEIIIKVESLRGTNELGGGGKRGSLFMNHRCYSYDESGQYRPKNVRETNLLELSR